MVFELANQNDNGSGDIRTAPNLSSCATDNSSRSTPSDTTSNAAINKLPAVEFSGEYSPQPVFRAIAKDAPPPAPQPQVVNPFRPEVQPKPFPQVNPGSFPPQTGPTREFPLGPKPGSDSQDLRDKPLAPGPFAPVPMSASGFTADQVRSILTDRDRAIALNRGQKPTDVTPGIGPIVPSPDRRNPFKPDTVIQPDRTRPEKTEYLNEGEFDQAVKAAADSGRPLVVSFTRPGCGYCTDIEDKSWPSQSGLVGDNAVRAKVDGWQNKELAAKYGVKSYPTTVVINPKNMNLLGKEVGFIGPEQLSSFLQNSFKKMEGGS
jgi:thiol-disulfide isomerase/thioredoxin